MTAQERKSPGLPPLKNLTEKEVRLIDAAVGDVLDNGFGEVTLKFEYTELKWITKVIPVKIQSNRVA